MSLDRRIFKAIKGHTEAHPQDLVSILAYVDSQERLVLTHEELSGGLQRLIKSGQIAEVTPHKYFDTAGQPHSREFSGLSLQDHKKACQAYRKWFAEQYRRLQDKCGSKLTDGAEYFDRGDGWSGEKITHRGLAPDETCRIICEACFASEF